VIPIHAVCRSLFVFWLVCFSKDISNFLRNSSITCFNCRQFDIRILLRWSSIWPPISIYISRHNRFLVKSVKVETSALPSTSLLLILEVSGTVQGSGLTSDGCFDITKKVRRVSSPFEGAYMHVQCLCFHQRES
jgi:hypothetical protein